MIPFVLFRFRVFVMAIIFFETIYKKQSPRVKLDYRLLTVSGLTV